MTNFIMIILMSNIFFYLSQMRISEILNQTQYFFDCLASDSVKMNKIGNTVARDKFFEGLEKLGVRLRVEELKDFTRFFPVGIKYKASTMCL